jgi:hypothetical protein
MERTWRRPIDLDLPRVAALRNPIGTALYFPGTQEVVDALLAAYDRRAGRAGSCSCSTTRRPWRVCGSRACVRPS